MKIVILDGHAANPGDLSWDEFAKLGELEVFDRTPKDQIVGRLQGVAIALTNKAVLDRAVISALPDLRFIGVTATGYNVVDIAAARERGIVVCNVPEYSTPDVAQFVFALLLELTNRIGHHAETVRAGKWSQSRDFCYWDFPLVGLSGLTLGIIGYGRIGRTVSHIGQAFGMKVLAMRRSASTNAESDGVRYADLDTLLSESDVVTLHCPLTPETDRMVNAGFLGKMKRTAFLINTARGGLVDEAALAEALNHGRIAGAGLDVLSAEPPSLDNPLLNAKNCIITPHIAWATKTARARLLQITGENIRAWLNGKAQNVVNNK
ncbi:MAG TPA: D-2-hydroxyacid dehydrogenase [Pseudomonadales bacterium]|nr:D-2-hydroxyacid dehydrogenase [Pseudomonadales bacterium]